MHAHDGSDDHDEFGDPCERQASTHPRIFDDVPT